MSRGDRREDIFYDDVDRQDFLKTILSVKAIAERLHLGTPKSARARLREWKRTQSGSAVGGSNVKKGIISLDDVVLL